MKKAWSIIIEALQSEARDYTEGPISRAIILLGIPMVLEMVMESVFAVTDIFFAGRLGPFAIATIGLTESLLTFVYTVGVGLSIGATAVVARRIGEHDVDGASDSTIQALSLGVFVSVIIGIIGVIFAPRLLTVMGGAPDVVEQGAGYMRVMFGGNAVIILLFLGNAIFRGAGDGTIAMRALWIANGLNVVLAPCFIFGLLIFPKLGLTGAACATTLSRGIGMLYALSHLFRGPGKIKVKRRHFKLNPSVMMTMIRLSASGMFQVFIGMASWVGLVRVVSGFGSEAVAGYTIGIRVVMFALFPAFGLSNAAATMVGQALGAKKPDRAEKAVWLTGFYNVVFLGVMGTLFVIFTPAIVSLFTSDASTASYGIHCLRTVACGFLFYAYGMVLTQSFNGAGDTWTPTFINIFVFWLFEIPFAFLLSKKLNFGPQGVFFAITIAFSLLAVISALLFKQGRWKTRKV